MIQCVFYRRIICLLIIFFNPFCFGQNQKNKEDKETADYLFENQQYDKSLKIYENLLQNDSKNYYLLGKIGVCYYNLENYRKAKEKFRLAALYCPVDKKKTAAVYFSNMASCYSYLNDKEKAYEYSVRAYNLDNEDGRYLWNATLNSCEIGKNDECIKMLDNAIVEKNNTFFSMYGSCYYYKGEYQKAIDNYEFFFKNYDEKDEFSENINLAHNKTELFYAYMDRYSEHENAGKNDLSRMKELFMEIIKDEDEKNRILEYLSDETGHWYAKESSRKFLGKLFLSEFENLSPNYQAQVFYINDKYQECSIFCKNQLEKSNSVNEKSLQKIRYYYYFSSLWIFIDSYDSLNENKKLEQTNNLASLFKNLYEDGKLYSYDEFMEKRELFYPIIKTLKSFINRFKSDDEQKNVSQYVLKILDNTPNEKIKSDLQILKTGKITFIKADYGK